MKFYGRDQEIAALTNELRLAETSLPDWLSSLEDGVLAKPN